jgi:hypothetical protein
MPEDHFGERVAERYDESAGYVFEPAVHNSAVDFLADLAGHGVALDLGISAGRIALPLSDYECPVRSAVASCDVAAARSARPCARSRGNEYPRDASYSRSNCARSPFAAIRAVCSIRFTRVS